MNTEKEITITELRGKFTKDFDTFGKMDPFAEFTVGKCIARTETADGAGKEPQWKNSVVLTYFDEAVITLRCYDEDGTENQYIGAGKIDVKGLRFPGGAIEVNVVTESGEVIGTVTGKYTIKNLNPVPLLLIRNVRCSFVKELTLITKSKPYFQVVSDQGQVDTEAKDEVRDLAVAWSEVLRLRVKESSKITLSLLDKNSNGAPIFKYESSVREFRLQSGTRKFNVFGADFLYLGTLEVDFESVNLISKEESVKNAEKEKKSDAELTSITIDKSKTELKSKGKDLYYQFVCGSNKVQTQVIKSVPESSSFEVKRVLYADFRENKLTVLIWESNLLKDKVLASAGFPLQGLSSGDKTAPLFDLQGKDMGSITLNLSVKQVPSKIVILEAIGIELSEGADMIGESEPYIVAKLGGTSNRTETGDKNIYNFKKGIELKYFDEDLLELQVWQQDVTNDQVVYAEKVKLAELKGNKGEISLKLVKQGETKPTGKLNFKYDLKNNAPPLQPPKKMTEKKIEAQPPPPPPKVEAPPEPKAQVKPVQEAPKKEEPKKEQPKKEQMQRQEPIILARKPSDPKPKFQQIKQEESFAPTKTLEISKESGLASQRRKTEDMHEESRLNRSINRSIHKDSMLPSISNNIYGDRIYDKQSAATLQKSIVAYSMPKASRFRDQPKYSGEPTYCIDSCFKSSSMKGVGFGFGRKKQFPDWVQRNMKEIPPPGAYFESKSEAHVKGPSFGISHKYYEKVLIAKEKPAARLPTTRKLEPIRERK